MVLRTIVLAVLCLGALAALAGPFLALTGTRRRGVFATAVAATLLLAALVAARAFAGGSADGGAAWAVAAIGIPLCAAAAIIAAVRNERGREHHRWVPAAVLTAFPAFVVTAVLLVTALPMTGD